MGGGGQLGGGGEAWLVVCCPAGAEARDGAQPDWDVVGKVTSWLRNFWMRWQAMPRAAVAVGDRMLWCAVMP